MGSASGTWAAIPRYSRNPITAIWRGRESCICSATGENIAGAAVLLESDDQWDDTPPAYYVHNLVGSLDSRGAGGAILDFVEQMAVRHHKKYVRLDCSIDNPELNTYYEKRGYHLAGQCQEGPYIGNRRQKAVEQS